jgi:hypothetical protein
MEGTSSPLFYVFSVLELLQYVKFESMEFIISLHFDHSMLRMKNKTSRSL